MIKFLSFFIISISIAFSLYSQSSDVPTCYEKYAKLFEQRGAYNIDDGWHEDIIITVRKGTNADCFLGKVKVENGAIVINEIYVKLVDDSYEKFIKQIKTFPPQF